VATVVLRDTFRIIVPFLAVALGGTMSTFQNITGH
jgi:hypothetical protein